MLIISFKPGHDGCAAAIADGELLCSYEAEKGSHPRYDSLNADALLALFDRVPRRPDVICHSGWVKGAPAQRVPQGAGYYGLQAPQMSRRNLFGSEALVFSSTHERSHIWSAYGMSPFPQGQPVYCLVYEGNIGRFYAIGERLEIEGLPTVLDGPGTRYAFLYSLADPNEPSRGTRLRLDAAGKLMALAAYGERGVPTPEERDFVDWLLSVDDLATRHDKSALHHSPFRDIGIESQPFKNLVRQVSNAILERFLNHARKHLPERRPLLIAGGCGLNCDWNRSWLDSGLFEGVFIPPVANDSGSAIGTAIDAQRELTGSAKLTWDVYAGQEPEAGRDTRLAWSLLSIQTLARDLADNKIVAVMRGQCEIGPRALGARSLLASPLDHAMRERLNRIKKREQYRPIAPVVLDHAAQQLFDLPVASPHMLLFARVLDARLAAVTHVDGSARPQTVNRAQNAFLTDLLTEFGKLTGVPVLCNTSLNRPGRGFINNETDLIDFCVQEGVDAVVSGDRYAKIG